MFFLDFIIMCEIYAREGAESLAFIHILFQKISQENEGDL